MVPKGNVISARSLYFLLLLMVACAKPLDWPRSPLYDFDALGHRPQRDLELSEVRKAMVGHYAHFDVVAYEDTTTRTTMRSFIVSYGFTEFFWMETG
ncbi:MAG: hypothetical protein R2751_16295 [Bacteroidales bacterium]